MLPPAMLDGILDQRLQQEARDTTQRGRRLQGDLRPQAIAETRLLNAKVGGEPTDFRFDRHDRVVDAVERMPQVGREVAEHGEGRLGMLGNFLGHAVQRIEKKVWIELETQLLQFGAQGFVGATAPKDGPFMSKTPLKIVPQLPLPAFTPLGNGAFFTITIPTEGPSKRK